MTEIKMFWHSGRLKEFYKGKRHYRSCLFSISLSGKVKEHKLKRTFRYAEDADDYANKVADRINRRQGKL